MSDIKTAKPLMASFLEVTFGIFIYFYIPKILKANLDIL